MRATFVAVALLLAGCITDPEEVAPSAFIPLLETDSRVGPDLVFTGCDELDFYSSGIWEEDDMGGLRTRYDDPAALTATDLFTAMRCERLTVDGESTDDPTALFYMVAVEPNATLRFANVTSYVWIGGMLTSSHLVKAGFGEKLRNETSDVALSFTSLGASPKAQAQLRSRDSFGDAYNADSVMAGSPTAGNPGTMAAYIGNSTTGLELFLISFSAYQTYSNGVAKVSAAFGNSFADEPWRAYHNIGFDATFYRLPPN